MPDDLSNDLREAVATAIWHNDNPPNGHLYVKPPPAYYDNADAVIEKVIANPALLRQVLDATQADVFPQMHHRCEKIGDVRDWRCLSDKARGAYRYCSCPDVVYEYRVCSRGEQPT